MSDRNTTHAPTGDEADRAAAMHRVYSYLLLLAAQKQATSRDEDGNQTRTAGDIPAAEPSAEGG